MKIMIDPGHGGYDPGACNGTHHEAVYALDIAKRLGTLLAAQGCTMGYTRTDDTHIGIDTRYKVANSWGANAFVSIHLNSAQESAHGVETLVYSASGKSAELAALVQKQVIAATGATDRGVKVRTDLGVLRGTNMPAILIETGFISNTAELARLATPAYRQTVAEAIARGVCAWAGITYKEDDDMTAEQVRQIVREEIAAEVARQATAAPENWASAAWAKAQEAGIMDGTRPQSPVQRQELAAVMQRTGLLGK